MIVPAAVEGSTSLGRLLIVDDDGLLLSVLGREETAIWSLDTMFSRTIANLARGALANTVDDYETP